MPYWDMPEALGEPVGNFPSFRGRNGELLPRATQPRALDAGRGVYGYSLAFMLTGEERYLTYAKAGLDWINTKAKDPVHGGYYGELDVNGDPVDPQANKDLFDLASLGLAYGMYFNVTRDPAAEADLLAVRDLIFDKYYDAGQQPDDGLADLRPAPPRSTPAATAATSPTSSCPARLSRCRTPPCSPIPARRAQFRDDLRRLTEILIARHKNTAAANPATGAGSGAAPRVRQLQRRADRLRHNIKSYEMILNANNLFADRPWDGLGRGPRDAARPGMGRRGRTVEPEARGTSSRATSSPTAAGGSTTRPTRRWPPSTWRRASPTRSSWRAAPRPSSTSSSTATRRTRPARRSRGSSAPGSRPTCASRSSARTCCTTTSTR